MKHGKRDSLPPPPALSVVGKLRNEVDDVVTNLSLRATAPVQPPFDGLTEGARAIGPLPAGGGTQSTHIIRVWFARKRYHLTIARAASQLPSEGGAR